MKPYLNYLCIIIALLGLSITANAQYTIPPIPSKSDQSSVYDYAKLLSTPEKQALETKLIHYADTTSTQMVVVIIPSLLGEDRAQLAVRWAHRWGIGQKKEDNGLIILLAAKERELYIAPGYGLEPILTAGINGEIQRNIIFPEFKKGQYYEGLDKGTDALMELFSGTYKASRAEEGESGLSIIAVIFLVIVLLILFSKIGKGKGNNRGNRGGGFDLGDFIILSSLGRGGGGSGGFGGSGGGGFGGGFGGGGFSGGGAGGSW